MFPVLGRPHEVIKVPVSLFQKLLSMFLFKMDLTAAKNAFASQSKTANNFSYLLCPSLVAALCSFQYKKNYTGSGKQLKTNSDQVFVE